MEERDILDHFESDPALKPSILNLCLLGFLIGIPAGFTHFFFLRSLPPPGDIGWLKAIILLGNQGIFLIMLLINLGKRLQLFSPKRQFYFGAAFAVSSVVSIPIILLHRGLRGDYQILYTPSNLLYIFNQLTILGIALSLVLLILLIRRYGESFALGPKKKPESD